MNINKIDKRIYVYLSPPGEGRKHVDPSGCVLLGNGLAGGSTMYQGCLPTIRGGPPSSRVSTIYYGVSTMYQGGPTI